jgi:hypothetical protein
MSSVSKELLKNVVNRFTTNGHSNDSSYLIVKYFIGLNDNKINKYEEEIKKVTKYVVQNCKNK